MRGQSKIAEVTLNLKPDIFKLLSTQPNKSFKHIFVDMYSICIGSIYLSV